MLYYNLILSTHSLWHSFMFSLSCSKPSSLSLTFTLWSSKPSSPCHHSFHHYITGDALSLSLYLISTPKPSSMHHHDIFFALCSSRSNHHLASLAWCSFSHQFTITMHHRDVFVSRCSKNDIISTKFFLVGANSANQKSPRV